jgi:hypothetical protein
MIASPQRSLPKVGDLSFPLTWPQAFRDEMAHRGLREDADITALYLGNTEVLQAFVWLFPSAPPNSDYFPILQLKAPKARFQGFGTSFFAEFKNADWPLLEVLTGALPPPLDYEGALGKLSSDYLTNRERAKAFRSCLLDGAPIRCGSPSSLNQLELLAVEYLKLLGEPADDLLPPGGEAPCEYRFEENLRALTQVARATIPFLRAKDLETLWGSPVWLRCALEKTSAKDYMSFIAASARRDFEKALLYGEGFLKAHGFELEEEVFDYVLGGTQLAAFALGDMEKVAALESQYAEGASHSNARLMMVQAAYNRMGKP